jgi:hypothetical protein
MSRVAALLAAAMVDAAAAFWNADAEELRARGGPIRVIKVCL